MYKFMRDKSTGILLVGLVMLSLIGLGFSPRAAQPVNQNMESIRGELVILRHDDRYNPYRVPAPKQAELGVQTADIIVNYNPASCSGSVTPWPGTAQAAFNFAVTIWESLLVANQPIVVNACWRSDLGPGVLGSAGPADFIRDFSGAPVANTWYPVALANELAGSDLNDSDNFDTDGDGQDADVEIFSNFSLTVAQLGSTCFMKAQN